MRPTAPNTAAGDSPAGPAGARQQMPTQTPSLLARHRRLLLYGQIAAVLAFFGFAGWAARGNVHDAREGLERANVVEFLVGCLFVGAYYLVFVVGWMKILRDWGIR